MRRRSYPRLFLYLIACTLLFYGYILTYDIKIGDSYAQHEAPVYVVGAYLVKSGLLRVILITNCKRRISIYASVPQENHTSFTLIPAQVSIMNEGCPFKYYRACKYDGFYAEFALPHSFSSLEIALFSGMDSHTVTVQRTLPSNQRKHFLAVCLPVLFYYSDPVQMIQILEHWLVNGASKFFLYWRSYSSEVEQIIKLYQQSGVDIETIPWSHLPNRQADTLLFYSGQIVSINDCLHRARTHAKFAVLMDMDEFLTTKNKISELLKTASTNSAGVSIQRKAAYYSHRKTAFPVNPTDVSFTRLKEIDLEGSFEKQGKLILRPENVRRSGVHYLLETEGTASQIKEISADQAVIVHLRNAQGLYNRNPFIRSDILALITGNITENWQRRFKLMDNVQKALFHLPEDPSGTAQKMEQCLADIWVFSTCFTASHCVSLMRKSSVDWQFPKQKWIEF